MVRQDNNSVTGLGNLAGLKVGTYKGALAQTVLEKQGGMDLKLDEMIEPMYRDLANGRLDATLLDHPLALYCGTPIPGLKFAGAPLAEMQYGMAMRKKDHALLTAVDRALDELQREGKLRQIFERWNLWTPMMAKWTGDFSPRQTEPQAWDEYLAARNRVRGLKERLDDYAGYLPLLAKGALVTLELSVLGMILAMVLGLFLAISKIYGPLPLRLGAGAYIELSPAVRRFYPTL